MIRYLVAGFLALALSGSAKASWLSELLDRDRPVAYYYDTASPYYDWGYAPVTTYYTEPYYTTYYTYPGYGVYYSPYIHYRPYRWDRDWRWHDHGHRWHR